VDIPLNYAINTGYNYGDPHNTVLILTINIGVNGGAAQPYAFDTGSAFFVTPNGTFGGTPLATNVTIDTYGNVATFSGNVYQTAASSLQFYSTPGATTGGITLGSSGNYNVTSYTSYTLSNNNPTNQQQPFGTAAVGVFGADGQAFRLANIPVGGVFGQTLEPNTSAGYIVSANGQSLAALNAQLGTNIAGGPLTGSQPSIQTVPQSITSCNPCVTVGLTPALLAQFLPVNTVDAAPGANATPFPNSNLLGIAKFVPFNFILDSNGGTAQFNQKVSLDTGWIDFNLSQNNNSAGTVLTMYANNGGTQDQFLIKASSGLSSPYHTSMSTGSDGFIGTGFFVQNSVLFDFSGQQVAYSTNFVTDANIFTSQPLVIDSSSVPLGLAGVISGPGGLAINAGGSATLSGTNTYTGATSVSGNGAYLALVGPGSISTSSGVTVSAGGVFDISGVSSSATIKTLSGDSNGVVWLGNNYLALSNAGGLFGGILAGSGGLALLSGNETLSGTNTYTGMTLVDGGTLNVTGSIASSAVTMVGAGAVLTGTGTVGPVVVSNGGTFAPAWGAPGTAMTVAGDLLLSSGSFYSVQLGSSATSPVNITGNAMLAGTMVAGVVPGSTIHKQYDILHAAALEGTTFSGVATNAPGFTTSLTYSATDVYLGLNAALSTLTSTFGTNAQHLAKVLDTTFNTTGSLPSAFIPLYTLSGSNLGNALNQTSGESATGAQQTTLQAMGQFLNLLTDPFMGRGSGVNGATSPTGYADDNGSASAYASGKKLSAERDAYAMFTKAPLAKVYEPRWSVWASGFGGSQSTDGNAATGSNSTTSSIYGTAVGAEYLFSPRTIAGFALAGGATSFSVVNSGSGRSDLFQAGAYVRHTAGNAYVTAALAYGWQDITTDRYVTLAGLDHLRAEFNANAWSGRLEGGYRFVAPVLGGIGIAPYAAGQFTSFDLPAYAESVVVGTPNFVQAYGGQSVTDVRSELGIRTDKSYAVQNGVLTLRGRLAWAHDFDPDRSVSATFTSLPGASFVVNGAAQASESALTTASVEMKWLNGWAAAATFEGEFSDVTQSYAGKGVVRYTW
jgi:autotransporter-associated beta strand protein